ncbi:lysophospholipid acyltransferase family protein [Telmatocola sphagniphila]|uniref:Lysophospholipid acyltransferase family protein n=1 Tax=Telmatocola sphagniphila TaxID=1123043 RepID=A0A8E6B6M0_9BACT|nr:lysophospholipid acyltransferase family protein [Telmatocola sphagniphila]QVL32862.1 lysophospholipid acyltransferase family protein [Telmatocola sphagniphila]
MNSEPSASNQYLPRKTQWLWKGFYRYCRRYSAKHFHAVRLSKSSHLLNVAAGEPLVFVVNHPSWWDIIVCMLLSARYEKYQHFAPIEAGMLPKYKFFNRLGFFGVEETVEGARNFLRITQAIFSQPFNSLWITAQGEFVDPRVRPVKIRAGVGQLATRLKSGWIIPIALEYPFWNEKTPEALVRIGQPLKLDQDLDRQQWTALIELHLQESMDRLAQEAILRDPAQFDTLILGKSGVGGVYDLWRRFKAALKGKKADLSHMDDRKVSTQ